MSLTLHWAHADTINTNQTMNTKESSSITPAIIVPETLTSPTITPVRVIPQDTPPIESPLATSSSKPANTNDATSASSEMNVTDAEVTKTKLTLPAGMVIKKHGIVEELKSTKKIHYLKQKSLFYAHNVILTKKDSSVALRFNDGSFFVLGPESALEIKEFHFTVPPKGQAYQASPKDRAVVKLIQGNFKARLGVLAMVNKPSAFSILTPRGRLVLSTPAKKPNIDLIYNNKIGLAIKAVGVLNNSKGQVDIDEHFYGLVSAVIGSAPTETNIAPLAFTDPPILSTSGFFKATVSNINTGYSETDISIEQETMVSEAVDSLSDCDASRDEIAIMDKSPGEDEGDSDDEDEDSLDDGGHV
jgi:hypothetical protein